MRQTIELHGGFRLVVDLTTEWVNLGEHAIPERFVVEHPGTDKGPTLAVEFEVRDGIPSCSRAVVTSPPGGREVRNADLRGVPDIDQLADVALEVVAGEVERDQSGAVVGFSLRAETSPKLQKLARTVRADAPRRSAPVDLAEVARVYEGSIHSAPTQAVAEHFGVTRSTASMYAARARESGRLRATSAGGRPRKDQT